MAPDDRFVSAGKSEQQEELPYTLEEFSELHGIALDDPKITKAYDLYWEAWREEQSREDYFRRLESEAGERTKSETIEAFVKSLRDLGVDETVIAEAVKKVES